MHKFTFVLTLVALLVISTTAVYAAISWDDDPSVYMGGSYWAHLQAGTDAEGGISIVAENIEGGVGDDGIWAKGCAQFKGSGEAAVRVWISKGMNGPTLGDVVTESGNAPGLLCATVEVDRD
ncbi:MAG: hypothetical protein ACE5LU_03225 [Anaerolineae bacterium]